MATLTLADGRIMAYHVHGTETGEPVLSVHGATDSGLLRHYNDALTASLGVRLISPNLPGVGGSSPNRRGGVPGWTRDAIALVDALGVERFCVAAHAGGAGYALSLARALPDRVSHIVLSSPTVGIDEPDMRRFIVSEELVSIVGLLRWKAYPLVRWALAYHARKADKRMDSFVAETLRSLPADTETIIGNAAQLEVFKSSFREGLADGGEGLYEVFLCACRPLDFPLNQVRQPVTIFYGDNDGVMTPDIPLRLAGQLRNCQAYFWPEASHYAFVQRHRWIEFLGAALG